ncbi:MAG: PAS domain-containing protein [Candidatus Competibacteraceae bacterium]
MNASLIRDAAGNPQFLSATALDITARKQAEDVLWKTQNSLAEAQKIAHLGSFEYDVATQQTVWSDEEYRIYGLGPAGSSPVYDIMLAECIHPDDVALLHQAFTTAMQSVSVYELEHRIVRPDGSVRWIYNRAYPYFDAEGTLVRYIGTTLDITERKHDEERLRRSEERLHLATDGAELGTWYWDMSTGTLEWSDRCKRRLGLLPGKEPSFEHFYAVMHPDDRDRIERLLAQAVENRSDYMADYRVTWPDGPLHWISAPGRVYGAANGDLIGMGFLG